MGKTTLYAVKNNRELQVFTTWADVVNVPKEYIDTEKPYRHTYYFTREEDCMEFADKLFNKYQFGTWSKLETAQKDKENTERNFEEFREFIATSSIEDLELNGYDNHEETGFELAKQYFLNQMQNFNEIRKQIYNK